MYTDACLVNIFCTLSPENNSQGFIVSFVPADCVCLFFTPLFSIILLAHAACIYSGKGFCLPFDYRWYVIVAFEDGIFVLHLP